VPTPQLNKIKKEVAKGEKEKRCLVAAALAAGAG